MLIFFIALAKSQTTWDDPSSGVSYDWSSLSKATDDYYKVEDSQGFFIPSIYLFNFGADLPTSCQGQKVAAIESIELFDGWVESCSIMGRSDMTTVKAIDNGIAVMYEGGDICYEISDLNTRRISFELVCSETEGEWKIVQSTFDVYCHVILRKETTAGCGIGSKLSFMRGLVIFIIVLALYCFIGAVVNFSRSNEFEMPHSKVWRKIIDPVLEKLSELAIKIKSITKQKSKGSSESYEMV